METRHGWKLLLRMTADRVEVGVGALRDLMDALDARRRVEE